LSPIERQLLAEAAYNRGIVSPAAFGAKYKTRCPMPKRPWRADDASLLELVIARNPYSGSIYIPDELVEPLRSLLPKPPAHEVATVDELPERIKVNLGYRGEETRPVERFETQRVALTEVRRVLSLARSGKLKVQEKSKRPTKATERLIASSLAAPDFNLEPPPTAKPSWGDWDVAGPVRAHAWAVVVQQCGWCKAKGDTLTLTRNGAKLAERLDLAEYRRGVRQMQFDDQFDELNRITNIRGQTGGGKRYLTHPSQRRVAIMHSMGQWPVGRWIELGEAFRFVLATGNEFRTTTNPMSLYFCEQYYGYLTDDEDLQRQYFRAFLFETLATLGLIDVAYTYPHGFWPELCGCWGTDDLDFCGRYDGLLYVRLNELGAFCLGLTEEYQPPEAPRQALFNVLANNELTLSGREELNPADESMLDRIARKVGQGVWRLDRERMLDYIESGGAVSDIRSFLKEKAANEVPKTVSVFLDDLERKCRPVADTQPALLIEFVDAATAAEVAQDSRTRKFCRHAGDRFVVVPKKNERAFRTALKKLGYVWC